MKKLLFLLSALLVFNAQSQIVIDNNPPYNTATYLIDNVLLGGGVIATNHSFQGDPSQIGWFDGSNSNLGIDTGIVLSSGDVADIVGPNDSPGSFFIGNFDLPGDPTLDVVIDPAVTNDAAVLEFDFVPTSDTLKFKYVFGSEEYLEYVATINDAFGFFLSGPNPAGGMYIDENLALIPGTTDPVSIFNVNDVTNSAYYIDNGDGSTAPQNTDPTVIQFDGFTTPLTAIAAVICGATYHIKLVVADAGDDIIDSGVFLEAGSFFSPPLDVVNNLGIDSNVLELACGYEVILTADGGIGALYEWYNYSTGILVATDPSITVSNGTYYVIASDISGCSSISDTFSINAPPFALKDFTVSYTDISCWDDTDGSIGIFIDDYTNILSYNFYLDGTLNSNSHPLDTFWNNVSEGDHLIQIVDSAYLCDTSFYISISAPIYPLQVLASSEVAVCSGGNSGELVGTSAGGSPGYIYSWYETGNPVSFSNSDTVSGLIAGSYYLSVEDANGCDTFTTVNIIEPPFALQGSSQIFAVACKGDNTGMIVGDAGGGWGPYRYFWLNSVGDTLQSSLGYVSDRDTLFDLYSGVYQLHIYDFKDCFVNYFLNISEPSFALSIDSILLVEGVACYGDSVGKAILYASGGQPNYAYLWDNGETSTIANGLTSGDRLVVLSDDWGCEVVDSIYIPESSLIESDLTIIQDVSCYGDTNGIATIISVGGSSSTYTYFWSQGQQTVDVNSDVAYGLLQGSYYVTTRDVLGCEVVDSIYISEPEPLSMEAFELDWIDCYGANDGLAAATAVGGTLPYTFDWKDSTGTVIATGDTINTLAPGLHTVVVTDVKGCSASDTVFTHEPTELMIVIDATQTILPYCIGVNTASLAAVADGGTPGYTYVWDDNVNLPQTTTTASDLLADNYNSSDSSYSITVTDAKGCTASVSTDTLRFYVESMDASVASLYQYASGSLDSNEVSCFGYNDGGAEVTAWGAHAPYVYQWFGGSSATIATIDNLYAGTYSVTIRDTNNCMVNRSIVLVEPSSLTFNTSTNIAESCLGACDGEVFVDSLAGGVAPYAALLMNNITTLSSSHLMSTTDFILEVCSGDYTVALTDINNCPSTVISGGVNQQVVGYDTYTVAEIAVLTDTICHASSLGVLNVLNPNLSMAYSYSWENVNNTGFVIPPGIQASSLTAGIYVLLADYNNTLGCTTTDTIEIIEYSAITNAVTIEHVDCYGESNGKINAVASSGVSPYTYSWNTNPIQNTAQATGLSAGTYVCTVTDDNTCENIFTYNVTEPQVLTVNITESSYVLTAGTPLGGTAPFSYSWREQSPPNTSIGTGITYTVTSYGIYYVVVTDANGCTAQSNSFEDIGTGISQLSSRIALSIYPNPFREETTVDFGREIQQASIRVVDVFGKLIEEYSIEKTDKHILKRKNKSSGIYFIEIEVEDKEKAIYKLIVE